MTNFNEALEKIARTIWRHRDLECEMDAEELLKDLFSNLLDELKGEEKTALDFQKNPSRDDDFEAMGYNIREQELRTKIEEIKRLK